MALINTILFTVVVIASILDSTRVNGRVISPQTNTIKAHNGDIYDCVDFYKQPAFQHPLLINHSFNPKMEPSFTPNRIDGEAKTKNTKDSFFGLKDGGCPFGTVPIRRVTKEQHDRATKFYSELVNSSFTPNEVPSDPRTRWAIVQSKSGPATPNYFGLGAKLGILNPLLTDGQFSSAQCIIRNGPDYIQFGWTVNPQIYPDTQTRMFIRTEAGNTHCYNTKCSGFVIVRTDIPLDMVLPHHSSVEELVMFDIRVFRDPLNGNWWLTHDDYKIGFWPGNILSSLGAFGTYIQCGGEAYSYPDSPDDNPQMGSGKYPIGSLFYDGFVENFVTVNDKFLYIAAKDTETFATGDKYGVHDFGVKKDVGHTFVYGGPNHP